MMTPLGSTTHEVGRYSITQDRSMTTNLYGKFQFYQLDFAIDCKNINLYPA
jgi:hypothetical protein